MVAMVGKRGDEMAGAIVGATRHMRYRRSVMADVLRGRVQ